MKRSRSFDNPADKWAHVRKQVVGVRLKRECIANLLVQFPTWRDNIFLELYWKAAKEIYSEKLFAWLTEFGMDVSKPYPYWVTAAANGYVEFARIALPHVKPREKLYVNEYNPFDALARALDRAIRSYKDAARFFLDPAFGEQELALLERVTRGAEELLPLYFQHGFDYTSNGTYYALHFILRNRAKYPQLLNIVLQYAPDLNWDLLDFDWRSRPEMHLVQQQQNRALNKRLLHSYWTLGQATPGVRDESGRRITQMPPTLAKRMAFEAAHRELCEDIHNRTIPSIALVHLAQLVGVPGYLDMNHDALCAAVGPALRARFSL